jgi:hypothetical protein
MSEELSFQEVEELLEGIVNNTKLVKVETQAGDKHVVLSHPTAREVLLSRYRREKALIAAEQVGLPSREEITKQVEKRKTSIKDKEAIATLEGQVEAQRRLLLLTKIPGRKKPIEDTIERLLGEISVIQAKIDQLYSLTREFRADEEVLIFLTWAACYEITGEKCWKSFEDFEAQTDLILRDALIQEFAIFNRGVSLKKVRYLARHTLWRIRYTAGLKLGGDLFTRGLHDLTPDQQALLYWSNYYNSIMEMLPDDRPDEETIKDDEALDAYMEMYFKQREQEEGRNRLKRGSGGKGKLSADTADEVIITSNHPEYLHMSYSEERVSAAEGSSEVEVVSPNSRRARNQRAARRGR